MRAFGRYALLAAVLLASPAPAAAVTYTFSTPIAGDTVPVTVTLADVTGGVDVTVSIPPGSGDLLGFFGNVVTESLVAGMYVSDPEDVVSQWQFKKNQVWKVGGGNTMSPVKNWDWGVMFEGPGHGCGLPLESAHFKLKGSGITVAQLTGAANQGWVLGVRIQDTNGPAGSAKIGMPAGTPPAGPPTIDLLVPANGALISTATVPASGTFTGSGVSITVNGATAALSGATFSTSLTLADGPHTITATATNTYGSAPDSASITVDTTPPDVTITAPADGALTTAASILVTGTVEDTSAIASFTLNGSPVALTGGAFSATLALALGSNPITASATDAAGHTGSAPPVTVVRGTAPTIAFTAPPSEALLGASPVTATGTVTGTAPVSVVVNGVAATVSEETFTVSVPLVEGGNTLAATATNAFGSAPATRDVTLDTTPPLVDITAPANGSLTAAASTGVSGTVLDASPIVSLTVNGVAAVLTGSAFTATVPLAPGANPITATATDAVGLPGSDSISVTRGEPPTVAITLPAEGFETEAAQIAVAGTVSGTEPVTVTVNGVAAAVTSGTFTATVPLSEGANTLTATATNALGTASDAVAGTRSEAGAPLTVSIATPPNGAFVSKATIAVAGLVSDPAAKVALNGAPATVTGTNYLAQTVSLQEGPNTLVAVATRGGETAQAQVEVTYHAPPRVVITSPVDGTVLRQTETDVEGVVDDPTAFVEVNGIAAQVVTGGRFTAPAVPLETGPNDLLARAVDPQGAQGTDQVSVTRNDDTTPRLRLVVVDRERAPFDLEDPPPGKAVVAEDLASFLRSLEAAGIETDRFQPPLDAPAVGTHEPVHLYVFAEEPGEVTIPLVELWSFPVELLRPIGELEGDLMAVGLDTGLLGELPPKDFDAHFFARFDLYLGLGGGGS